MKWALNEIFITKLVLLGFDFFRIIFFIYKEFHCFNVFFSKSAPQFLLNVYDKLSSDTSNNHNRHVRSADDVDVLFTEADNKAIDQSDIIMTFLNKSKCIHALTLTLYIVKLDIILDHHVSEVRHEKGRRLWFDVNEMEDDAELILAELRLYQRHELNKYGTDEVNITVAVYSIINLDGWVL